MTAIYDGAFKCDSLNAIYVFSAIPPFIEDYSFTFSPDAYSNATLYVPEGYENIYGYANGWRYFNNIKSFDPTGVESVKEGTEHGSLLPIIYNMEGKVTDDLRPGFNIIRYGNGESKIVLIQE